MIQPTTPYMLRKDGTLLECGFVHPYLITSPYEDIDSYIECLDDLELQWFMDNTQNEETKEAIIEFRKTGSKKAFKKIFNLTNNEFCRVRTSNHKYKYGGDNGEIYFRLTNTDGFNWFDLIWNIVMKEKDYVKDVTILRDYSVSGNQFDYYKIKGKLMKHVPVEEFLTMSGNPILENRSGVDLDEIEKYKNELYNYIKVKNGAYIGDFLEYYLELFSSIPKHSTEDEEKMMVAKFLYAALQLVKEKPNDWIVYIHRNRVINGREPFKDFYILDLKFFKIFYKANKENAIEYFIKYLKVAYNEEYEKSDFIELNPDDYIGE